MVATDGHRLAHIEKLGATKSWTECRAREDADTAQGLEELYSLLGATEQRQLGVCR